MPRIAPGARTAVATAGLVILAISLAACSTGSPLALEPAVDVGVATAGVPAMPAPDLASPPQAQAEAPYPPLETVVERALAASDAAQAAASVPEPITLPAAEPEPMAESFPHPTDTALVVPDPEIEMPAPAPASRPKAKGLQTLVPSNPMMVAYPRAANPVERPTGLSADDIACRRDLKKLGVAYKDLAPINAGGACRIDHPVLVSAIGSVKMQPAATLNCEMAATFARWTRKELVPSARWRYLAGVKTIHQGSSYSCRRIARTNVASEHARGNALDVMRIELTNGKDIDVRKPGWFAFRQRGLLNKVRADACDYFTTVLGPGYNYDHRDHFHFDIKPRKRGYRACR